MSKKTEYHLTLKKVLLHFHMINKHRFLVLRLSLKVGIPWQGLKHDLSKYSFEEFWESAKYYTGKRSPITNSREVNGYSKAFLHHTGRNKHHYEYWYDFETDQPIVIPCQYVKEIICDNLAAGMSYQGKKWTKEYQLSYWDKVKDHIKMNEKIKKLLTRVYTDITDNGINAVVTKQNIEKLYKEYVK